MEFLIFYFVFSAVVGITILWEDNTPFWAIFYGAIFGFILFPIGLANVIKIINTKL